MKEKPFVSKLHVLIYILNANGVTRDNIMEDVVDLSKSSTVSIVNLLIELNLVSSEKKGRKCYYKPTKFAKELFNMP